MAIYIELPCKPVIKQYIANRYGTPVIFPQNDWLYNLLCRYLQRPDTNNDTQVNIQYYTTSVDLPIKMRDYSDFGNALTPTAIRHINQTIQDVIEEVLYNYMHFYHCVAGYQIKDCITAFRHAYHFDEEHYSTDAITKFFQRERARRQKAINLYTTTVLPAPHAPKLMR